MRKTYSYFLILLAIVLLTSCSQKDLTITVLFKQIDDLTKSSYVYLDDLVVGEVKKIKLDKNTIAVKILVYEEYREEVKSKSDFYITGKDNDAHVLIVTNDENSPPFRENSIVKGSSKTDYWLHKGTKVVKNLIDKGVEKTKGYFASDEWDNLKSDISHQVDIAAKKGKKELDKQLPILKKKAIELYEDSPEILSKITTYIDSLGSNTDN